MICSFIASYGLPCFNALLIVADKAKITANLYRTCISSVIRLVFFNSYSYNCNYWSVLTHRFNLFVSNGLNSTLFIPVVFPIMWHAVKQPYIRVIRLKN